MKIVVLALALFSTLPVFAKEVTYDLTIADQHVNITGKPTHAMTINGGIPGPTLRFREGDVAVIHVHNGMQHDTSIHWHGLLLPNDMDGVPYLTYPPIKPGATFTYRFPIRQSGTYWYHSHTHLQEQIGVYGSLVIEPKSGGGHARDHVVVLGDWSNEHPHEILRTLRRGSEAFSIQKHTAQSVLGAAKTGTLKDYFSREAMRMPAMDLADVAYDGFITNGKLEESVSARAGDTIRLRIINAAASSYFHLNYAGGPFTIVAADGQDVVPLRMNEPLFIAIAETYDVLVKIPSGGAYEFRATAQDGSGKTSLWLGTGERHFAPDIPKPFLYESMMGFDPKHALALTPQGVMGMNDRRVEQGEFDQPGMNMGSMNGMEMGGMDHSAMGHAKIERRYMASGPETDHSTMNHSGMNHAEMDDAKVDDGKMDHSKMDHSGMNHGEMDDSKVDDGKMDHANMDHGDMDQSMMPMSGMMGMKHNPPRWYDFLLQDDAALPTMMMSDGMAGRPFSPYKKLRAVKATTLPSTAPRRVFRLTLDGEMGRYVWMINNRPLSPSDDLFIKEGEVVRFILINRTMMHHPMHLHGHFFRVLNGQGDRSPLKHTVNVEPMSTTVIEFMANEPGDWFFHCHILYHMMSGMARVVRYEGFTPHPETAAIGQGLYTEHNPFLVYGYVDALSNMTQGQVTASSLLNIFNLKWEAGWAEVDTPEWEATLTYERFINRFTNVFVGLHSEGADWSLDENRVVGGVRYLLPGNFLSTAWVDSDGGARVTLDRELMLTPRLSLFGELEYDTRDDWSYQVGASYFLSKYLSATTLWDSDYGWGAGVTFRF